MWWLAIKALPWRVIGPALALVAVIAVFGWQVHKRHRAEDALALATARVAALEAAGRAQNERAALVEQAWQNAAARFAGEASERVAAIAADRESLAGRLREYAARASRGAVPEVAGGAGGGATPAPEPGGAAAALDRYDTACRIDAEWLAYWQAYARAVGVEVSSGR